MYYCYDLLNKNVEVYNVVRILTWIIKTKKHKTFTHKILYFYCKTAIKLVTCFYRKKVIFNNLKHHIFLHIFVLTINLVSHTCYGHSFMLGIKHIPNLVIYVLYLKIVLYNDRICVQIVHKRDTIKSLHSKVIKTWYIKTPLCILPHA